MGLWGRLRALGKQSPKVRGRERAGLGLRPLELILRWLRETPSPPQPGTAGPRPPRPTAHMVLLFQASSPGPLPLGAF